MTPEIRPDTILTVADFRDIMGHDPSYPNLSDLLPGGKARETYWRSAMNEVIGNMSTAPRVLHSEQYLKMTPREFFGVIDEVISELGIDPNVFKKIRAKSLEFVYNGDVDGSVYYEQEEYFPLAERIMDELRKRGFTWDDLGTATFYYSE